MGSWPPEVGFASRRGRGGVFSSKTHDEGGLLDEGESTIFEVREFRCDHDRDQDETVFVVTIGSLCRDVPGCWPGWPARRLSTWTWSRIFNDLYDGSGGSYLQRPGLCGVRRRARAGREPDVRVGHRLPPSRGRIEDGGARGCHGARRPECPAPGCPDERGERCGGKLGRAGRCERAQRLGDGDVYPGRVRGHL